MSPGGESGLAAPSPSGDGIAGPSRSQESSVLVRPDPPSVDSLASAEHNPWSHSCRAGGRSRSHFLQASLSRDRETRGGGGGGGSVVVPTRGLLVRVPGLTSCAPAPWTVCGLRGT